MSAPILYHIGLIVADLEAAAAEFSALLGLEWAVPRERQLRVKTPDGDADVGFRFTYSRAADGAPMIELVQGWPDTPWWVAEGEPAVLHHIGFWSDDLAADAGRLEEAGARIEMQLVNRDGTPRLFTYQRLRSGPLIELVDVAHKPGTLAWIRGETD